ncbi:MAG TPA: DUF445 family protein, partial [Bacillota bacterium]|nr:DUF445 family protein [Bacillota bacterium]
TLQEAWRTALVEWKPHLACQANLTPLFDSILNSLLKEEGLEAMVARQLYPLVVSLAEGLAQNTAMLGLLEEELNFLLSQLICSQHYLIGNLVQDSLQALTDEKLNLLVQSRVGQDLQWIRINGSMIGGALGFLVYILLYGIYLPLLPS